MKLMVVDIVLKHNAKRHLVPDSDRRDDKTLCGRDWTYFDRTITTLAGWQNICILCRKKHMNLEGINAE